MRLHLPSSRRTPVSPFAGPALGLAELPPTRRRTGSARTGGPGLDARRPEAFLGPLLPRRCPPIWMRGRRRRRPTRAGGPRPGRAAAGGVARPSSRGAGRRSGRAAVDGGGGPPAPAAPGLDARRLEVSPGPLLPRCWAPVRTRGSLRRPPAPASPGLLLLAPPWAER